MCIIHPLYRIRTVAGSATPLSAFAAVDTLPHSGNMLPMTKSHYTQPPPKPRRAADKMRSYRAKLRRQGLRPVQLWVPDTRAPGFAEALREQSLMVSRSPGEERDIAFVEGLLAENLDLPKP
jgi:hypothetical protein